MRSLASSSNLQGAESAKREVIEALSGKERVFIIHHWDGDGLCSASLLKEGLREKFGAEVENCVPDIVTYLIDDFVIRSIERFSPDAIVVADLGIPPSEYDRLQEKFSVPVVVIDHHRQETTPSKVVFYNPVVLFGEDVPSTTLLVDRILDNEVSLRTVVGIVGDLGLQRVGEHPIFSLVRGFLEKRGINLETVDRCKTLMEAAYRIGKREETIKVVDKLIEYGDDVERILSDEEWNRYLEMFEKEWERLSSREPEKLRENVLYLHVKTDCIVTSVLARKIAFENPGKVAVVVNEYLSMPYAQIYVRRYKMDLDLSVLIRKIRSGAVDVISVGGKKEVMGVIAEKGRLDEVLNFILENLPPEAHRHQS
ncbi:MAG: DHH family phosphoesterase [Candidatus Baldrarchaeia archaeon]